MPFEVGSVPPESVPFVLVPFEVGSVPPESVPFVLVSFWGVLIVGLSD